LRIEASAKLAIDVQGDFTFESLPANPDEDSTAKESKYSSDERDSEKATATPFTLKNIHLAVPRGELFGPICPHC